MAHKRFTSSGKTFRLGEKIKVLMLRAVAIGPWAGNPVEIPTIGSQLDVVGATVVDPLDYPTVGSTLDVVGATVVDPLDYPTVGSGLDVISS